MTDSRPQSPPTSPPDPPGSRGPGDSPTGTSPAPRREGPRDASRSSSPSTTTRASPAPSRVTCAGATARTTAWSGPSPGSDALDVIREVVLRGEQVAVLLADYRMPQMNGVEFLESAMDLVPQARRALLTAYADTSAAIAAINVVDVDHYLLKPWEPPEEKLYPVIDDMLDELEAGRQAAGAQDQDPRATPGRRSRTRSATSWPATWSRTAGTTSRTPTGRGCSPPPGKGPADVPVVVTTWARRSSRPSLTDLANAVGLEHHARAATSTTSSSSAAARPGSVPRCTPPRRGSRPSSLERAAAGGQAGQSSRIENYLGFPDGVSGAQLTDRARRQAVRFGAELLTARSVVGLKAKGPARADHLRRRRDRCWPTPWCSPPACRYRQLDAEGADDLVGPRHLLRLGLDRGGRLHGRSRHHRRRRELRGPGGRVLLHARRRRSPSSSAATRSSGRCRATSIDQVEARDNIEVRTCTQVERCEGDEHLRVRDPVRRDHAVSGRSSTSSTCSSSSAPRR